MREAQNCRVGTMHDRNIERILTLSTAHAPGPNPEFGDVRTADHEYGWIVFVAAGIDEGADWLRPILMIAWQGECTLILFDQDASTLDGVQVYDW